MSTLIKDIEEVFGIKIEDPETIKDLEQVEKDTDKIMEEYDDCLRLTAEDYNTMIY